KGRSRITQPRPNSLQNLERRLGKGTDRVARQVSLALLDQSRSTFQACDNGATARGIERLVLDHLFKHRTERLVHIKPGIALPARWVLDSPRRRSLATPKSRVNNFILIRPAGCFDVAPPPSNLFPSLSLGFYGLWGQPRPPPFCPPNPRDVILCRRLVKSPP